MAGNKKYILLGFILFLALGLRLYNLGGFEVTGDEGSYAYRGIGWNDFMVSTTMNTPWNWFIDQNLPLWTQLSFFDHPPLHFAAIWLSTHLLGISLLTVRLPSAIFGVLSVLMIILIFYRFGWEKIGLWSGLFLAVLPWHIWISRQAQQESLLIFLILFIIYLILGIDNKKAPYWLITGIVIGLAFLTKYSAVVIIPLLIWYFFSKKWYKEPKFWLLALSTLIVVSPVIIYNLKFYQLRGHFDLQFSRLLHQNLSKDWPANVQMIVQGSTADFKSWPLLINQWLSLGGVLIIIIGLINGIFSHSKILREKWFWGYGLLAIGITIAAITSFDSIRGSVLIPFFLLAFGLSLKLLPQRFKINLILPIIALLILLPAVINIYGDYLNWPSYLSGSFKPADNGFIAWEKWLAEKNPAQLKPIHFSSINEWAQRLYDLTLETEEPIILFDHRFNWFALNWHFLRHSFYTTNYPVIHPTIFMNFLLNDPKLPQKLVNKKIIYLQNLDYNRGAKSIEDEQTKLFDALINHLIDKQKVQSTLIVNSHDENVAEIWQLEWDANIKLKPTE